MWLGRLEGALPGPDRYNQGGVAWDLSEGASFAPPPLGEAAKGVCHKGKNIFFLM